MRHLKTSAIITLLVLTVAPAASLSCARSPPQYTVHCPQPSDCERDILLEGQDRPGPDNNSISPANITENFSTVKTSVETYMVRKAENRKLPSISKALESDKGLCPSPANVHLYSKENFEKPGLKHQDYCYRTKINEGENYYRVTREATTEPWYCISRHQDTMISGGYRAWISPIKTSDLNPLLWTVQLLM